MDIENLAKRASVPVAFNLDHGANFEDITAAMQYGFSSVMIDSSSYEFEENVRRTQQIASLAHGMGLSCEAELGHVGQAAQADDSNVDLYTNVTGKRVRRENKLRLSGSGNWNSTWSISKRNDSKT